MVKLTQYSAANLFAEAQVEPEKWNQLPPDNEVAQTVEAISQRGIAVVRAKNGKIALEILKDLIPPEAEVMHGSSTTLVEIGYDAYVNSDESRWKDLHRAIVAENDEEKRRELRRKSVTADYFISGANAIAQSGEIVACDKSGSRVGAWPYAAAHLIFVSGTNKIAHTLDHALRRVWEYAYPLENVRAKRAYGAPSQIGKCVILANEEIEGRVTLILIDESLGY
ncbi:MAG: lactate utilization protein [Halobacteriota archaeon]